LGGYEDEKGRIASFAWMEDGVTARVVLVDPRDRVLEKRA
jgi:hypothetical protein